MAVVGRPRFTACIIDCPASSSLYSVFHLSCSRHSSDEMYHGFTDARQRSRVQPAPDCSQQLITRGWAIYVLGPPDGVRIPIRKAVEAVSRPDPVGDFLPASHWRFLSGGPARLATWQSTLSSHTLSLVVAFLFSASTTPSSHHTEYRKVLRKYPEYDGIWSTERRV